MAARLLSFMALQVLGGGAGWWLQGEPGALVGVVLAGLIACALDALRGARVLRWLREPEVVDAPRLHGLWGEVGERARRAFRTREQATRMAERRLQDFLQAIQASPIGVVLLDPRGQIEWCNQTAAQHLGLDAQRDLRQAIGHLVREPAFAAYLATGDFSRDVVVAGRGFGGAQPPQVSLQLHPYGDGRRLLLSRDVTALQQADAMRRDFVANVSHEIRTPLTVLSGFVETLRTLPLQEEERARYLALMAQQAARMQTLVSDLLTLSKLEGGPAPGLHEWTPLQALAAACEQEAHTLAQVLGKPLAMRFEAPPALELAGNASEVGSALSNLVGNAVRYTPAGGEVHVRWLATADGALEFSVRDSGPGITAEHLPRLTERFYRVDRSRSRESGGTGLGLSIVKHVAQRHGGALRIQSTLNGGSTFSLLLPATRLRPGISRPQADSPESLSTATPESMPT